jgi:hypothetical protein
MGGVEAGIYNENRWVRGLAKVGRERKLVDGGQAEGLDGELGEEQKVGQRGEKV